MTDILPTDHNDNIIVSYSAFISCENIKGHDHYRVTSASIQLYTSVKNVLRDSTLPGRCHYMFSLSQLVSLFQVLYTT